MAGSIGGPSMRAHMPHRRDLLGIKCPHCGSGNVVMEHYAKSGDSPAAQEPWCMTCARSVEVPDEPNRTSEDL